MSDILISLKANDRADVASAIKEISNSMTRMEAERDNIKAILDRLKEKYEVPPKFVRKAAKAYHAQMFSEMQNENETFEDFYEEVFGSSEDEE